MGFFKKFHRIKSFIIIGVIFLVAKKYVYFLKFKIINISSINIQIFYCMLDFKNKKTVQNLNGFYIL
ncbi:hypothetical protein SAMN05421769_3822 [Chryseobacterium scophthalmum]|uniref:Uncharacterized protein n=1 Tax=Chryseobacterium scophthalmum TaxID=59733 RepID=A0A1N6IW09_9FLAO|nr:hypothetical protein SAMN05421769_3822 [Chryseobacterium scophthalmum]